MLSNFAQRKTNPKNVVTQWTLIGTYTRPIQGEYSNDLEVTLSDLANHSMT